MDIFRRLNVSWGDLQEDKYDPRVTGWFMMQSPTPTYLLISSYILFVTIIGPSWMEKRKPFQLDKLIIGYNIFQVCLSAYLFYEACMAGWIGGGYNWRCQPTDFSNDPHALRAASACWLYFMSKFTEFLDTIFFVLRKKNRNISFLHVVHHSIMPLGLYFGVLLAPGGHGSFFGLLNTFVHIIMYSYYLIAALGAKYQKYLWWKKYLTILQLVQFVAVFLHSGQLFFRECNYPRIFIVFLMGYASLFIVLFSNFYVKAYMTDKKVKIIHKDGNQNFEVDPKHD